MLTGLSLRVCGSLSGTGLLPPGPWKLTQV